MKRQIAVTLVTAVLIGAAVAAQDNAAGIGGRLIQDPGVKAALTAIERDERALIEEQIALCEIPAPPFMEAKRAEALRRRFAELGLKNVRIDAVGNVLGERPGLAARPHLVFSAHLDTVFPDGTDVRVKREGPVLAGPGIGDDCRGLAVLIGVIKALNDAQIQTPGPITFVGDVGEEGLGDLRGVKQLFNQTLKGTIDRFVSVDGTGSGITHVGVGSLRYRITIKGPGGHSFGAFGLANPIHALGRAMAAIADFQVPSTPKVTFNVGRIGGGTSVNAIAYEAWLEMDMRSADVAALKSVDARFHQALDEALAAENQRWANRGRLTMEKALVGDRPAGQTPAASPIVEAAVSVTRALGLTVSLGEGSTDSNVGMNLGVPSVTISGGGRGTGAHSLGERFDTTDSYKGTQRAFLLALALTQK
jgi:acetylornithine deacetylase/succinyl-diaminopimelate desuccinylase-like protein